MKKNKKQDNMEILRPVIIALVIMGLLFLIAYFVIIKPISENIRALDSFCKEKGYDEATDWRSNSAVNHYANVECDGDEIFFAKKSEPCLKLDKWGECAKRGIVYS